MQIDLSKVEFSNNDLRRGIRVPNRFSEELAEDIGYHIGDGYMKEFRGVNSFRYTYEFCYSGHINNDKDYMFNVLLPRKEKLFNLDKYRIETRENYKSLSIRFASKVLFTFYKYALGVQESPKKNIAAPKWVLSSNKFKASFLRGLIDSDGCLTFLKRHKKVKYYPIVRFCTASKYLFEDVQCTLSELGIKYYGIKTTSSLKGSNKQFIRYNIDINGVDRLNEWMSKVGFNNSKHIQKLEIWRKFGYIPDD